MRGNYKTVLSHSYAEIEEKKSRFIANVMPIETEEEAVDFINKMKTKYWNARHNVYAYSLCGKTIIQRYSDDGEPSGTAGVPVLEVIKRREIDNVVIVVTRYFGGILLGASGLIRAYGKCAAAGIDESKVVEKRLCNEISVITEYTLFGKLQNYIIAEEFPVKDIVYEGDVEIILYIDLEYVEKFTKEITEISNGQAIIEVGEKVFITVGEDGKLIKMD